MSSMEDARRKKRVARLKKEIITIFLLLLFLPNILCFVLLAKQSSLKRQVRELSNRLEELALQIEADQNENNADVSELFGDEQGTTTQNGSGTAANGNQPIATAERTDEKLAENAASDKVVLDGTPTEGVAHHVYLTFDDGPSVYTDDILDILKQYGVKATFFVVGKTDEKSLASYKRIVEEGHTLGMHSYSHKYSKLYSSVEAFSEDYEKLKELLEETTGVSPLFYRFPGGSSNTVSKVDMHLFADFLEEQGVVYYDWNISIGDAGGTAVSKSTLVKNALESIDRWENGVILMHDSGDKHSTVEALPEIIEQLQARGDTEILPLTEQSGLVQHLEE